MARYKHYDYGQSKLIAVHFDRQVLPGTFEYTLSYLVEHECDLSWFESRYCNDETGAPAYDPAILLKVILFAYSRGITSSRAIARACEENVVFMALSADTQPHFTTIASFISTMGEGASRLFRDVLLVCDEQGLIGREMFAVDGVKLPSNASKEWSGTRSDFERKAKKMEVAVQALVGRHRRSDEASAHSSGGGDDGDGGLSERERRTKARLEKNVSKIRQWLSEGEEKLGRSGKPVKSNLTDNDSAKMASSHGVIQGYVGVTVVDGKHQVIVNAGAFGEAQEHALLRPMLEGVREQLPGRGGADVLTQASVSADSGFHTNENVRWLAEQGIDAYLADNRMRKRDPRYAQAAGHDPGKPMWGVDKTENMPRLYTPSEFRYDAAQGRCWCPAGYELRCSQRGTLSDYEVVRFRGTQDSCGRCSQRERCLRHPRRTAARQVAFFGARVPSRIQELVAQMRDKVDSRLGKLKYGLRLAIAEPPFANLRCTLGLDRFTLRGRDKVNPQWLMFTTVHNIGKLNRFGYTDG